MIEEAQEWAEERGLGKLTQSRFATGLELEGILLGSDDATPTPPVSMHFWRMAFSANSSAVAPGLRARSPSTRAFAAAMCGSSIEPTIVRITLSTAARAVVVAPA